MDGELGEYRLFQVYTDNAGDDVMRYGAHTHPLNQAHLWGWQFVAVVRPDDAFAANLLFQRIRICTPEEQP